jgi:hypothetical protein
MGSGHGFSPIKAYILTDADGRTLQELKAANREQARKHARQWARTHGIGFKLIELRAGKSDFVVDIFRRQGREHSV